jgi:hypothetical protein
MAFLPKRLVNSNLYTAGGEFIDTTTGQPYTGTYHELFNGQTYSGETPNSPNKKRLIKNPQTTPQNSQITPSVLSQEYQNVKNIDLNLYKFGIDPETFIPSPTGQDYRRGNIIRYFAKRRNSQPLEIKEISETSFNSINAQDGKYNYVTWEVISLIWKISGPLRDSKDQYNVLRAGIINTNERLREQANQQIRGIKGYLSNLIQFAIRSELELVSNKYTGGGEFVNKLDNSNYTGYYHIMADGTIMDGATHNQTQNKILLPVDVVVQEQINTLIKEALRQVGAV